MESVRKRAKVSGEDAAPDLEDIKVRFEVALEKLGKAKAHAKYDWAELRDEVELAYSGRVSDKAYKGGYWGNAGVYQKLKDFLWAAYVPTSGGTSNDTINMFIDVNKIAYDMYNNGWCNNVGFSYTECFGDAPPIIRKISKNIQLYEKWQEKQERAIAKLEEAQSTLDGVMEDLAELCCRTYRSCCRDEEPGVYGVPFTYLDVEHAMNVAIRQCIGAPKSLNDAKVYPNIDLDEYKSDDEKGGQSDKDSDDEDDEDEDEEDEEEDEDEDEEEDDEDDDEDE